MPDNSVDVFVVIASTALGNEQRNVIVGGVSGVVGGGRKWTDRQRVEELVEPVLVADVDATATTIAQVSAQRGRLGAVARVQLERIVERRHHHETLVTLGVVLKR